MYICNNIQKNFLLGIYTLKLLSFLFHNPMFSCNVVVVCGPVFKNFCVLTVWTWIIVSFWVHVFQMFFLVIFSCKHFPTFSTLHFLPTTLKCLLSSYFLRYFCYICYTWNFWHFHEYKDAAPVDFDGQMILNRHDTFLWEFHCVFSVHSDWQNLLQLLSRQLNLIPKWTTCMWSYLNVGVWNSLSHRLHLYLNFSPM